MQKYTSSGTLHRTPQQVIEYARYLAERPDTGCVFCVLDSDDPSFVAEHAGFWIIKNLFPYALWDDRPVTEHLMIVPKRHIISLAEFDADERYEYMDLIGDYEQRGYSIYSRTDLSPTRSVPHQHTHLIRISDQPISALYYTHDPHVLIYK